MRTTEISNATISTEAVAPRININWNPLDDSGSVQFQVQRMEFINGEFQRMLPEPDIQIPLDEIMTRIVSVNDKNITGYDVTAFIKAVFDQIYSEAHPE